MIELFRELIHELLAGASHGLALVLLVSAVIMFATWAVAYTLIIVKCFRERTYGVPLLCICLNISWEAILSFGAPDSYPRFLEYGDRFWVFPDMVILAQLYLFGRDVQTNPYIKRHFYVIVTTTLVLSALGVHSFIHYFNDVYGLAAAFILAVIMAVLFIFMVFERPDLRGLSYPAAWLMLIGNVAAAVFCYYWWPLQFEIDRFGGGVAEPKSYLFLYLLYVIIPLFNGAYIYLLHRRRRELRETRVG